MPEHADLLARHRQVLPSWLALYYDEPIALAHGEGRHVTDAEGNRYLDFFAGILTTMTGYNVPEVVEAIRDQAGRMLHTSTLYLIEPQIELAERLAALSNIPDAKVFFTTSGSEANEAALLLASNYRKSNQVLALRNSYHGRSFATIGITGNRGWSASSLTPFNVQYVQNGYRFRSPFRDLDDEGFIAAVVDDLRDVIDTTTAGDVACLIAEPIQGVGGFTIPPDGMFGAMKKVLDETETLFISDEVQTGWGRTGEHFWGYEAHGIVPEMLTFAKGLGNGLSMAGVIARGDIMDCLQANSISTFGGNPLVCAGSLANLQYLLDHDLQANVSTMGRRLLEQLAPLTDKFDVVGDVRGRGLMLGIEFVGSDGRTPNASAANDVLEACKAAHLLVGKGGLFGNCIRIAPPLSITADEIDTGAAVLGDAVAAVDAGAGSAVTVSVIGHWVDGKPWEGSSDRTAPVFNPATGEVTGQVRLASEADVHHAVTAARAASAEWRRASLTKRASVLFAFRELVSAHKAELARAITAQHGKVHADALGEVGRGLEVVDFACGLPHLLKGGYSEQVSTDVDVFSIRQPVGVCAGITPFNFPAMVPMWMFPVAIACGNAFVLKPSERDPGASLLLAELWADAGLPSGVFTVVQGDKEAVNALLTHPEVDAVSFVGSTPIARHVYETAANSGKRVQALGGAKNHMIVLPDADLDQAADAAVSAGYGSAGERCMAISVVVAVDPVGDELVGKIRTRLDDLQIGDGTTAGVDMGPLITDAHRDRVSSYIDVGEGEGATLVADGRGLNVDDRPDGFWLGPTLFDHVRPDMSIYRDEIFGPVLSVVRAPSYEDAVQLVNENAYGNGVALFTRDGGAARRFQFEIEAGMVGINVPIPVPMAYYSFGGWNDSLFGDTHMHGTEGIHFYTRGKVVTSRWADPETRGPDLGFPTHT